MTFRGNNGESGLSRITDVETPLEISFPVRDDRMAVRVTPVSLNAGGLNANDSGYTRFGGFTQGLPIAADASVGSQMDSGVGLAVAYEMPSLGLKADLGSSPIGFQETNVVGGISLDRPFTENGNLRYNLNLSRRPVIDSLVSTMADYTKPAFPKTWIWQQTTALTKAIKETGAKCVWVGPTWGTEGGKYGKTFARVELTSKFLASNVAPCDYIDSLTFAKQGQWATIDGQHLTSMGYASWSKAITEALLKTPAVQGAKP
ncbi:cellulose synthase subunit BcsC-related outer membrane protein [Pseudomonas japonica]|uniref:cellulose synthase subunit BcsC-related outer membrane protein n=1 Tax=Pseudomonas japonica TaxID=256466 RepID=UPI003D1716BE